MDALTKQISEEAADWLLRVEEDPTPQCQAEFAAWLKRSPRHIDEFLMVEASYRTLQSFNPHTRSTLDAIFEEAPKVVVPLREEGIPVSDAATVAATQSLHTNRRRVRLMVQMAVAATLVIAVLTLGPNPLHSPRYVTAIGEQRAFKLPDGSLLNLNTQSRVEIDFSAHAREVHLVRGEALFTVRQDASRPFRVSTDTAVVQAIGTAFNVYRRPDDSTFVSVVEGRVNVTSRSVDGKAASGASAVVPLSAGQEADVSRDKHVTRRAEADVSRSVSWRQRRLVFRETPLREVAAQFNRYNADVQLHVVGNEIATRHITGTFDADEPRAFMKFLTADSSIRLESEPGSAEIRITSGLCPDC